MKLIKKIKIMFKLSSIVLGLIFMSGNVYSQEITAINFNGEPVGKVIPDGKVVGFENNLLGSVTADSLLIDGNGVLIGGVVPQGIAIGNDIRILGKVGSDGTVRGGTGQIVGKTLPNGMVVNDDYDIIGQVISGGLVYNDEGKVAGRVTGDGLYTSITGEQIGVVMPDGYAYKKIGSEYILDGKLISSKMVISINGDFIGSVVPGGKVTDFDSKGIGSIKANGFVYDNNSVIGKIVNSGYSFDENGNYIGFVSYNGEIIKGNKVVGKMRADGFVSDINGDIIGKSISFSATATDLKGKYLGRVNPDGKVVRDTLEIGVVGAGNSVYTVSGAIIGKIISTGPVFDYKGELKGHALSNGSVINLGGTTIGFMIGADAYGLSGTKLGSVLEIKAVYDQNNNYMGISGISSKFIGNGENLSVSPMGYVFSQSGGVVGQVKNIDIFYTPYGSVFGYQGLNGKVVNQADVEIGRVVGNGYALNAQNNLTGKNINDFTAVNYKGADLGYLNNKNILLNSLFEPVGKILPDGTVSSLKVGNINFVPKIGQAYAEKIALDFRGNFLGYVDVFGQINNISGVKTGYVVTRDLVVDNNGNVAGFVVGHNSVINDNCEIIGVVSENGAVYNYRGVYVGKILSNGYVLSDSGIVLGKLVSNNPVINFNGQIVGYTSYSGKVISPQNTELGCLNVKNQLVNDDKTVLGGVISYSPVIDYNGAVSAYSTVNGLVVNNDNGLIGYQQPNGNINSNSGLSMGYLFEYKIAFDWDNKIIGYITEEGKVINNLREDVGNVDFDGYVVSDGKKIGYALYDVYVYDKNDNPVGMINKYGEVISFSNQNIGSLVRGFVVKNNEVIARGKRDYNIRNSERSVIGQLQFDGKVIDASNNIIGSLSENGKVVDSSEKVIGYATPLQYYNAHVGSSNAFRKNEKGEVIDANGNVIGKAEDFVYGPDGKILGRVDKDGNVYDENGNLIGRMNKDGNFVDKDGNVYDKDGNVIGRMNKDGNFVDKDGNVYNKDGNVIGRMNKDGNFVDKDGNVYDKDGNVIGRIDEDGNFIDKDGNVYDKDGNLIGYLNEKGEIIDKDGNVIRKKVNWFDKSDIMTSIDAYDYFDKDNGGASKAIDLLESNKYQKSLGIALTPDGEYLGAILEDNTVVNDDGDVVGYRTGDGLIVDDDGELIGIEERKYGEDYDDGDDDLSAETSPFIPAGSFGPGGAYGIGGGNSGNLGPGGGYGPGERYDPARQAALNAAMQNRRSNISVGKISSEYNSSNFDGYQKDWAEQGIAKSISSWRVDMSEMIFSDKPIPAVIARAIDTNNPAPITAYVERNVYAEEGRNIIIPAGSRIIGAFGSITSSAEATSESARVQITWERLIRPDGSIFVFSGQTADAQGRSGALGYVDQQLFKKYTLPAVTTILTSAATFFMASAEDSAGEIENSKQQAASDARQNFLNDMETLFDDILADKTDVKAMTYVPAGTRIIIYPNTDLWLNSDERAEEAAQAKLKEKPTVFINDGQVEAQIEANERKSVAASSGGTVVYSADDANVNEAKSIPFIDDGAMKAKNSGTIAPPPPPPSSGTISAPPPTTSTTTPTNESIPALF